MGRTLRDGQASRVRLSSSRSVSSSERYAYLHGFASSPRSRKALALRAAFEGLGATLEIPDLNAPSFERLSHKAMLARVDELYERDPTRMLSLVGSSLGGWVAARYAELNPDRVSRLVLLCPGFRLAERWPKVVGEEWFEVWERQGTLALPDAEGRRVPVHFGFIEEARREPGMPEVSCETLIIHGTRDETVPVSLSREYVSKRANVRLLELDDDHALGASHDRIVAEAQRHFGIGRTTLA
jgi:uncharacterized protein